MFVRNSSNQPSSNLESSSVPPDYNLSNFTERDLLYALFPENADLNGGTQMLSNIPPTLSNPDYMFSNFVPQCYQQQTPYSPVFQPVATFSNVGTYPAQTSSNFLLPSINYYNHNSPVPIESVPMVSQEDLQKKIFDQRQQLEQQQIKQLQKIQQQQIQQQIQQQQIEQQIEQQLQKKQLNQQFEERQLDQQFKNQNAENQVYLTQEEQSFLPMSSNNYYLPEMQATKKARLLNGKEFSRAEQQRLASKKYREKKKILVDQLERKLVEVLKEKDELQQKHDQTLEMVSKLKKENENFVENNKKKSQEIEEQRREIIKQLSELLKKESDEIEIVRCLSKLKDIFKKIQSMGQFHLHFMISPSIINQLAQNGFFEYNETQSEIQKEGSMKRYVENLFKYVSKLTNEQKEKILEICENHEQEILELHDERNELNKEISSYFSRENNQLLEATKKKDVEKLALILSTLEYLRKNIAEEALMFEKTVDEIFSVLTPRQTAQFYTEVEYWNNTIMQLKNMWDTYSKKTEKSTENSIQKIDNLTNKVEKVMEYIKDGKPIEDQRGI